MSQEAYSFANLANLPAIEELYGKYKTDPKSVDASWRYFFDGMQFASQKIPPIQGSADLRVYLLIHAYRTYGHLLAHINPLAPPPTEDVAELNLQKLGFQPDDLEKVFPTC